MKPRTKFLIGGALVARRRRLSDGELDQETGVYYLTPTELSAKIRPIRPSRTPASRSAPASFPVRFSGDPGGKEYAFRVTDGSKTFRWSIAASRPTRSPTAWTSSSADGWGRTAPSTRLSCSPSARRATRTRPRQVQGDTGLQGGSAAARDPHRRAVALGRAAHGGVVDDRVVRRRRARAAPIWSTAACADCTRRSRWSCSRRSVCGRRS